MQYRELGNTGLKVSVIGLGCGLLGSTPTTYATQIVRRALDLGINFFDVARIYRDGEAKLGIGLEGRRHEAIISTKTGARTRDEAWSHMRDSLALLRTDYLDNCHLHGVRSLQDLDERMMSGGPLDALIEARQQGVIRHLGLTSHLSDVLIEALNRFDFEFILVPMNIVEREPLERLIPLCYERGVGVTIMKPVATGLLPATLALKWLLNQPIASTVPGCTTLEELEENAAVGSGDYTLSEAEQAQVEVWKERLDRVRCRICFACEPCPVDVPIPSLLGTDVMYDHYRSWGREAFMSFRWSRRAIENDLEPKKRQIAAIEACTRCGECDARCPYGLPVSNMLQSMVPALRDMVSIYEQLLNSITAV